MQDSGRPPGRSCVHSLTKGLELRLPSVLAATVLVGVCAASAQAAAGPLHPAHSPAPSRARVPSPTAARHTAATRLRASLASAQVSLTVSFKPRHPLLLAQLASRASGAPAVPAATLRRLFAPTAADVAATTAYLRAHGLRPAGAGLMTRSYTGPVSAAESAFGTQLSTYRAHGVTFRSPESVPTLPAAIAPQVAAVSGLDTYPTAQPLLTRGASAGGASAHSLSSCAAGQSVHNSYGGYQPGDLAAGNGYDYQSLLNAGNDGGGEVLALVEFSDYSPTAVSTFQSCYGTGVPISTQTVGAGPGGNLSGSSEVELDMEVAAANAPGLDHIYDYAAPSNASMSTVLDSIVNDVSTLHTTEVSISWGLCEPATPNSDVTASDTAFQLLAAEGVSVFSATGDSGSSDCHPLGTNALATDYPSTDPYVTAVGGTTLDTSGPTESAWGHPNTGSGGGGGGGVSINFPMPPWQTGTGVISADSSHAACGQTTEYCREVPDVALDANPDTGYVVNLRTYGWTEIGGTSAAAPLMAAMTADANEYSLGHGGARMGFASPFLYANPGIFRDITSGSNVVYSGVTKYAATAGYDMATGLGAPDGADMATALAATTSSPPTSADTSVTSTSTKATINANAGATVTGMLTSNGQPVAHEQVLVDFFYTYRGVKRDGMLWATTGTAGKYTIKLTTATIKARASYRASFLGDVGLHPSQTPTLHVMHVQPLLTLTSSLHWNGTRYTVKAGKVFTLSGLSKPALAGQKVSVQWKPRGAKNWKATGITAKVGSAGKYSVKVVFGARVQGQLRFARAGSLTGQWTTAYSPVKAFTAS